MELNLAIIADWLDGFPFLHRSTNKMAPRTLQHPVLYKPGMSFSNSYLYLANAEELAPKLTMLSPCSIICLGYPPANYHHENCELLCLPANTDIGTLLNAIIEIFHYFASCNFQISEAFANVNPIPVIKEIVLDLFQTPCSTYNRYEKLIFQTYDSSRPEFLSLYSSYVENTYIPEDERSILYTDQEFLKSLNTKRVSFLKSGIYGTDILYLNLFDQNYSLGRILLENTYRDFKESDYALLEWLGEYMIRFLKQSGQFLSDASKEFEQLIRLLLQNVPYQKTFDEILLQEHWKRNQEYLCITITCAEDLSSLRDINEAAYYLKELFSSHHILIEKKQIIQIYNLSNSTKSKTELLRLLNIFLKNNNYIACISSTFSDLGDLWKYYKQTLLIIDYALNDQKQQIYHFNDYALEVMLNQITQSNLYDLYCTDALKKLFRYDNENGSELAATLKCYLDNNLNASKTQHLLHIARTTCIYRIERIKEITKLNLEDHDTILYLRILFRLWEDIHLK